MKDLDEDFIISPSVATRVQKNSLVTLRCQPPAGNPSPAVSWWKDGRPVDTHKNRRVFMKSHANFSLVVIRKAKLSDGGYYSCVASNLVGRRESAVIKMTVYGKLMLHVKWTKSEPLYEYPQSSFSPQCFCKSSGFF